MHKRKKVCKLANDVFQMGEVISHDDEIFGTELDLSMNYVFSVITRYIGLYTKSG